MGTIAPSTSRHVTRTVMPLPPKVRSAQSACASGGADGGAAWAGPDAASSDAPNHDVANLRRITLAAAPFQGTGSVTIPELSAKRKISSSRAATGDLLEQVELEPAADAEPDHPLVGVAVLDDGAVTGIADQPVPRAPELQPRPVVDPVIELAR